MNEGEGEIMVENEMRLEMMNDNHEVEVFGREVTNCSP